MWRVHSAIWLLAISVWSYHGGKAQDSAIDIDAPDPGQSCSCLCTLQTSAEEAGSCTSMHAVLTGLHHTHTQTHLHVLFMQLLDGLESLCLHDPLLLEQLLLLLEESLQLLLGLLASGNVAVPLGEDRQHLLLVLLTQALPVEACEGRGRIQAG